MTFGFLVLKKEFEDSKWIIRIHISKDRQYNGKTKKDKRTNNNLQNTTNKTKDRATQPTTPAIALKYLSYLPSTQLFLTLS